MDVKVPPSWKTKPHSEDSVVNKKVILHCQADGSPPPVIRWKKSTGVPDADFRVVISNANVQILENGSLLIREADVDDGGHYMCQATNGVNPDLSMVVELNIHVAVQTDQRFETHSVRRGENVVLQCRAKGDKPITVTWTNEMIPLIPRENPRSKFHKRDDRMSWQKEDEKQNILKTVKTAVSVKENNKCQQTTNGEGHGRNSGIVKKTRSVSRHRDRQNVMAEMRMKTEHTETVLHQQYLQRNDTYNSVTNKIHQNVMAEAEK
ncbi:cell adhesion molecule Dscam2-like [Tachypleus tridentatus]|uniref:cell adhesion molecule Dscam2-like n=1 Tax=Tachypleus tridentatus TaxID=6853 RepID=UPI003FD1A395